MTHNDSDFGPEGFAHGDFWAERAQALLQWDRPWTRLVSSAVPTPETRWFQGAALNAAVNCLDRHLAAGRGEKPAIIWQGEPEEDAETYTYQRLHQEVCRMAGALAALGVGPGDVVAINLPALPEVAVAMLACARLGAVHFVSFAGLSGATLVERLKASRARTLVTADGFYRSGRLVPLKPLADEALALCPEITRCIVVRRAYSTVRMVPGRDLWWHELADAQAAQAPGEAPAPPASMAATDPLFILYTTGASGHPKGVVHSVGGFLTQAAASTQAALGLTDDDILWCTADPGWINGQAHALYGPLCLGATTLMYGGSPTHPQPDRIWRIVEKYGVTVLFTDPALVGQLMREGEAWPRGRDLAGLRLVATVGSVLSNEARQWLTRHVARSKAAVVNCWGQTESGGVLLASAPGADMSPLPGVDIAEVASRLMVRSAWPGMAIGLVEGAEAFAQAYFQTSAGAFDTGDQVRRAADGTLVLEGRAVELVSGGSNLAAIEAAIAAHPDVAEVAALSGDPVRVFVTVRAEAEAMETGIMGGAEGLEAVLAGLVRAICACALIIRIVPDLPKTRSGKIARQALRQAAMGNELFGDTSLIDDPSALSGLFEGKDKLFG